MKARRYGARLENAPNDSQLMRLNSRKNSPKLAAPTNSPSQKLSLIFMILII